MSELPFVLRSQYREMVSKLPLVVRARFEPLQNHIDPNAALGFESAKVKMLEQPPDPAPIHPSHRVPADEPVVKDCLTTAEAPTAIPPDELLPGEPGYVKGPVPPSARLGVMVKEPRRFRPIVKNGRQR